MGLILQKCEGDYCKRSTELRTQCFGKNINKWQLHHSTNELQGRI